MVSSGDPAPLRASLEAFRAAGWKLIENANYGDGEYTLAAAINTLIEGIKRRPQLKAWLPFVVGDRVQRFMQAPAAGLDMAAHSELDDALDRAEEFNQLG